MTQQLIAIYSNLQSFFGLRHMVGGYSSPKGSIHDPGCALSPKIPKLGTPNSDLVTAMATDGL